MKQSQQATNKKHYLTSFPSLYCHHSNRPQHAYSFQPPPCDHSCTTPESLDHNTATTAPSMCFFPVWTHPGCGHQSRQTLRLCAKGREGMCEGAPTDFHLEAPSGHHVCRACVAALRKNVLECSMQLGSCLTSARLQLLWNFWWRGSLAFGKEAVILEAAEY